MKIVLGIDIGGTNTTIAFVNEGGEIMAKSHLDTLKYPNFDRFVDAVYESVKALNKALKHQIYGVGIGAPNGNFYTGKIEFAPNLEWKGMVDVVGKMKKKFGIPVFITNDANAAAIGEMKFGNGVDLKHFVIITLGTGVGSGVVVNGELVYGHDGFAGEVGHMITTENGRKCGCGRRGCLETYASVTGLRKSVAEMNIGQNLNGVLNPINFEDLTGKMIEQAALQGDEVALKAFDIAGKELGKALAGVAAVISPEAIFLFGGMANAGELIFKPVKFYLEQNLLDIYKNKIKVLPSGLKGNEAAIKGAAALAWNELDRGL